MSNNVLGILNMEPNYVKVEGIEDYRPISAGSVLGRYRTIDFMMSNFTNSRIQDVKVYLKNRPRSLIEHIHNTNYNLNSKRGKIHLLYGEKEVINQAYNTDLNAFHDNMEYMDEVSPKYVIIAPSHFIFVQDFSVMLQYHLESGNDITILYQNVYDSNERYQNCDVLSLDDDKNITAFHKNRLKYKKGYISLETYIMTYELFKDLIDKGRSISSMYSLSDIIADSIEWLKVGGYHHTGRAACINNLKEYYDFNMAMKDSREMYQMFQDDWPIFTMTTDSCPTLYLKGSVANDSLVGNGCRIEGSVIGSVIGRNVSIGKDSVVKDCVISPNVTIGDNVYLENAVVDRFAYINTVKELRGEKQKPLYIARRDNI